MVRITYFVHGTTTDNENDLSTGWLPGELSQKGIEQSVKLKEQVAGQHFDVVFSSDLKRAIDSAELAFKGTVTILHDERLRECNYGDLNGTDQVDAVKEDHITIPFPHGESYHDVEKRLRSFVEFLKKTYPDKHVAIVAHQAPQLALEVIKGKTWEQAFAEDWRKRHAWQPGWEYLV